MFQMHCAKNMKYDMLVYYFKHKQRKCIAGLKDHVLGALVLPVVGGTVWFILCVNPLKQREQIGLTHCMSVYRKPASFILSHNEEILAGRDFPHNAVLLSLSNQVWEMKYKACFKLPRSVRPNDEVLEMYICLSCKFFTRGCALHSLH